MPIVKGLDTIRNLVGEPPEVIDISFGELKRVQLAINAINHKHIAIIPYCFKCKVPLDWMMEEPEDGRIFICPNCHRTWVKGEGWSKPNSTT